MTIPITSPRPLAALLTTAAIALTGTFGAAAAKAEPHPDHRPTYEVSANLDGRSLPAKGATAMVDFLHDGQEVPVICQKYGGSAYGSKLWDLVSDGGWTLFVPDRFIKTGTDGRAPDIKYCGKSDLRKVKAPPTPFPPTHP
jgi:hypothetical protein